jgi:magnesium-transporting ATPase (P-type)
MKHKLANKKVVLCTQEQKDLALFKGRIDCQGPNEFLYKFEGNMTFTPAKKEFLEDEQNYNEGEIQVPLDASQMLLRGSSLRNTEYAYAIVVYTGHQSKIMKNSPDSRNKTSKIEKMTNKFILITFAFQIIT